MSSRLYDTTLFLLTFKGQIDAIVLMKTTQLLSPCFDASKKIYLMSVHVNKVELDICPLTGGIWFDRFEIKKFDEIHEDLTELLATLPKNPVKPEIVTGRSSPKHKGVIMQQQPYGPKGMNGVLTVDVCSVSAGIWLDHSELEKIRELYPKEQDRQKCVDAFVGHTFQLEAKKENHSFFGLSRLIMKLSQ